MTTDTARAPNLPRSRVADAPICLCLYVSVALSYSIANNCINSLYHLAGRIGRQFSKAPYFRHREGSRWMEEEGKHHYVKLQDLRRPEERQHDKWHQARQEPRVQFQPRKAKSAASVPGSSTCKSTGQATSWPRERRSIREAYQRLPATVLGVNVRFCHHSTPAKSVRHT